MLRSSANLTLSYASSYQLSSQMPLIVCVAPIDAFLCRCRQVFRRRCIPKRASENQNMLINFASKSNSSNHSRSGSICTHMCSFFPSGPAICLDVVATKLYSVNPEDEDGLSDCTRKVGSIIRWRRDKRKP
uniref:Uncharacterized protein n=1 Tax=Grammatophora oceanica TaxID=210454 RepID=A0A7S1VC11_9STRA|mmetsp:Transcript_4251/g.5873  ORF Transcript_4251/g.5873 Transcript_4251/m.5873 type:complete len:131 (+) Transcript_4251:395-787(+)